MEQVRESDGSPVKYLYRRVHLSKAGRRTTRYCARFVDWQGIRRSFALGADLARARVALRRWLDKNAAEVDFDALKVERAARGMTFAKWAAENVGKANASHIKQLEAFFGGKLLAKISDADVQKYREKRSVEKIIRHGEASKVLVSQTTINKELSTLRKLLRLARTTKKISDQVTAFPMAKEPSRKRVLDADEYKQLLENAKPWLRRACVMAFETSLSRGDILGLTWDQINLSEGVIVRDRNKTDVEHVIPIETPELKAIIEEMRTERLRLPATESSLVFTLNGEPIPENLFEYWFRAARKNAGISNFHFHDLRHCAITRWAAAGIPTAIAMQAAGHSSAASHHKYQNMQRDQMKSGFRKLSQPCLNEKPEQTDSAASG
jgi:integrase